MRIDGWTDSVAARGAYQGKPILVFLGDYIDRGFQSREVIDILLGESLSPFETNFLKGNHEAAMLQFLDDAQTGPRWASFGGIETLVSYGVRPPQNRASVEDWELASEALNAALPPAHLTFLANLDLSVRINAKGIPGLVLFPVSKLFEYVSTGTVSDPEWLPKIIPKEFFNVLGMGGGGPPKDPGKPR